MTEYPRKISKKEQDRRLKVMAVGMVDMEQGVFQFPDGKIHRKADGSPLVIKTELVKLAGYAPCRSGHWDRWFKSEAFQHHVALERARRLHDLPDLVPYAPTNLLLVGRMMVDEVLARLKTNPDSFTNSQLLQNGPNFVKMGLELEDRQAKLQNPTPTNRIGELNAYLGNTIVQMDPEARAELLSTVGNASDSRFAELQTMIDALQAKEEDDGDVIDAEISPEPS